MSDVKEGEGHTANVTNENECKLLESVLKKCMETLNIKMTTQQSIELGLVQIIDVHVNV